MLSRIQKLRSLDKEHTLPASAAEAVYGFHSTFDSSVPEKPSIRIMASYLFEAHILAVQPGAQSGGEAGQPAHQPQPEAKSRTLLSWQHLTKLHLGYRTVP